MTTMLKLSTPMSNFILPDWPAPAGIRACSTVRDPGDFEEDSLSQGVFSGLNLGAHVGDDTQQVHANRLWVSDALALPQPPVWLNQVHGTEVLNVLHAEQGQEADAAVAYVVNPGPGVCAVMTADCLPVLLCDMRGKAIAAVHAGWRGLLDGVLENTVSAMGDRPHMVMAWLGPAIGPKAFEVGVDVVEAFVDEQAGAAGCFTQVDEHHWLADIYALARLRLQMVGVRDIYGGDHCTYTEEEKFYSYRRDGQTGRMASFIWFE